MSVFPFTVGAVLILLVLWDVFETIVLPRRVKRRLGLTRIFYRTTWLSYSKTAKLFMKGTARENFLSYFGPLSLILLLIVWVSGLITGFALVDWAISAPIKIPASAVSGFGDYLYFSGTNFFTLGIGDITPLSSSAKVLTVLEAGIGLGLLALVIGYVPSLNQSFSRRETHISLMDARAGSPPTAGGMILRQCEHSRLEALTAYFSEWETWSAELLESHLSYPVLGYFRSQHQNQSWLAAITAILDTCAVMMAANGGSCARQARLTFAIARHGAVDLSLIFFSPPIKAVRDRLPRAEFERLTSLLGSSGIDVGPDTERRLSEFREMYEPFLFGLARYFQLSIPSWLPEAEGKDNWQTSAWDTEALKEGKDIGRPNRHF